MALTHLTNIQSNMTKTSLNVEDFGAKGDGSTDDTVAIQNAINAASSNNGIVVFNANRTYITQSLGPQSYVELNLNGSTLKLKNNTGWLLFDGTSASGTMFKIKNGTFDLNKSNNNLNVNQSAGGIWLVSWTNVILENLNINNAYRTSIVLNGCSDIILDTIVQNNCGLSNAFGMYAYGIEATNFCYRLSIRNFTCKNFYGFVAHFYQCFDFTVDNITSSNIAMSGEGIAITCTQSSRGRLSNIYMDTIEYNGIEINACTDLDIYNGTCNNVTGNIPLLVGDNGTGIYNERIKISNYKITSTGFTYSSSINYAKYCTFEHLSMDKGITTNGAVTGDHNNIFTDCTIGTNINTSYTYYNKFHMQRVSFSNFYINYLDGTKSLFSNPQVTGSFDLSVNNGAVTYVDLNAFNGLGTQGFVAGKLQVLSWFNNVQGTWHEVPFYITNDGSHANLGTVTTISGSSSRIMTIAMDAVNMRISITNSTGDTCFVQWSVDLLGAMS